MKSCANTIINRMQSILPLKWEKVFFCLEIEEQVFSGEYYVILQGDSVPIGSKKIVDDYSVSKNDLYSFYKYVYEVLFPYWKKIKSDNNEPFSHYSLIFDRKKFDEELDYKQLSDKYGFFDYLSAWRKKNKL